MQVSEAVEALEWERDDRRFALLTTDAKMQHNVTFYSLTTGMESGKAKKDELTQLCSHGLGVSRRYDSEPRVQPALLVSRRELHSASRSGRRVWNSIRSSRRCVGNWSSGTFLRVCR